MQVLDEVFDLFVELGADDETLDFPVLYASGRAGTASWHLEETGTDIIPVFEALLKHVPAPHGDPEKSLQIQISSIHYNDYVGRIGVGRIYNGRIKTGQQVTVVRRDGTRDQNQSSSRFRFSTAWAARTSRKPTPATSSPWSVWKPSTSPISICDPLDPQPLDATEIEPPTLTMMFSVNDSPFVGKEGKYVTSRNLRERLFKELESNVALKVEETADKDAFKVSGRGLLHLGILIENMRREGYELSISKPHVIVEKDEDGNMLEPIEYLVDRRPGEKSRRRHGTGRQSPRRTGPHGQPRRAGPPGIHHPRPRPDRPANPHAHRHAGPGRHAPQFPRIRRHCAATSPPASTAS